MNNACEVYELREDMEYQPVCEDSKVRVCVSLVRSDAERELRAMEVRRRNQEKRLLRSAIIAAGEVVKMAVAVGAGYGLYSCLAARLLASRGYPAIGSELIFAGLFGAGVWFLLDKILGGDHLLEK
ncbi:MAG: hypothetical protein LUG99_00200 [Lachnospiraceae bacterium]|nr:hypothetical protein [Lachnospiraceae bacterium]